MKLIPGILAGCLLLSGAAYAIPYDDLDIINVTLNSDHRSYTSTFNIVDDGYNPANQQVLDAYVRFDFSDPNHGSESLTINLGSTVFDTQGSFSHDIMIDGWISGTALFDLSVDGVLSYTITATSGEFKVDSAYLWANAGGRCSVPDGGSTVALAGCGLLLLGVVGRRFGFRRS